MDKNALILFAHGARDPEWAAPMRSVRAALQARSPDLCVELAFLEFMQPDLETCASMLAEKGYGSIVILPMFIAQGGHLKKDAPALISRLQMRFPSVRFSLAPPVGEAPPIIEAMAGHALDLIRNTAV